MTEQFERQLRYYVIKRTDALSLSKEDRFTLMDLLGKVDKVRRARGKKTLDCVVVEHDWPEFEPVWAMVAARMSAEQKAATGALNPMAKWPFKEQQ